MLATKTPPPQQSGQSFDAAIKQALQRGLSAETGEGARGRVMGRRRGRASFWALNFGGVSQREVFAFCQQLAVLLDVGMPLVKALFSLANRAENPTLRGIIQDVGVSIEEGEMLSEALGRHSKYFPALATNMIRAGELSGKLTQALNRVATHGERLHTARFRLLSSLIYPAFVIVVAIAVVAFAFSMLVANMNEAFGGKEIPLSKPMALLMSLGSYFRSGGFWIAMAVIVAGAAVLYSILNCFRSFRLLRHRVMIRLPIMGYFVKESLIATFSRIFTTLYGSGVPLLETLQATRDAARNEVLRQTLDSTMKNVREGGRMTPPLEQGRVFPPLAYDMLSIGEEAGALSEVTERVADFYEDKLAYDTQAISKVVQPVIVILLALVVGFVVIALISLYPILIERIPTGQ